MRKVMFLLGILVFILSSCQAKELILITFETNGGNVIEQNEFELNPNKMNLPTPQRTDYQFEGWYLDTTLMAPFSFDAVAFLSSVTLYAKWSFAVEGISFNSNGGSVVQPIQAHPGTPIVEPIPTLINHVFQGWFSDSSLTQRYSFENMPTENILLFAKWLSTDDIDTYIQDIFASNNFSLNYSIHRSLDPIDFSAQIYSETNYKIENDKIYIFMDYPAFDESFEAYFVAEDTDYMTFSRICSDGQIKCWSRSAISDQDYQATISTLQFNSIMNLLLGYGLNMSWFNQDGLTFSLDEDYYQEMNGLLFNDDLQSITFYEITLTNQGFSLSLMVESDEMYSGFTFTVTDIMQTHIEIPIFDICEKDLFDYSFDHDGAIITGYYGDPVNLTIPSEVLDQNVIGIDSYAFEGMDTLEHVSLPSTIEVIGDSAFANCTNLNEVHMNSAFAPILGANAFLNTSSSLKIYVPFESVTLYQDAPIWSGYHQKLFADTYYTITFNGNGGDLISGQEIQYVSLGGQAIAPLYRNGALYLYWNVSFVNISQDLIVTAQWSKTPITAEGFTFTLKDDLTYEVTLYEGSESNIYIQDTYLGLPVTSIGSFAFESNYMLQNLVMPNSITRIENSAFLDCYSLQTVVFSNQLTYIGPLAFSDCENLRDVILPTSLEIISHGAFQRCFQITNLELPESLIEIGDRAFSSLGAMKSISIPASVESIGNMVFYQCLDLESIIVSPNNLYYQSFDGVLYNKLGTKLIYYPTKKGNDVIFLDQLVTIGTYAFLDCHFLTSLMLPLQIIEIEDRAFQECDQLEEIYIPDSVSIMGRFAFLSSYKDLIIYTGARAIKPLWDLKWNSDHLTVIWDTLAYDVTFDGNGATLISGFEKQVVIENRDAVAPIYDHDGISFAGWNVSFTDVTSNLTVVAQWNPDVSTDGVIFTLQNDDTYEVTGYTGSSSIVRINNLHLGKPVTSIGRQAFFGDASITHIYLPETLITIDQYAFINIFDLIYIHLPDSLESIATGAFYGCTSLTEINIPSHVSYIGTSVFSSTNSLSSINVSPENAYFKSIDGILLDKSGTIVYNVPSGITGVVIIPDGVTHIFNGAISWVNQMTDIILPESLQYIDTWNFYECSDLENVTLLSVNLPELNAYSFIDCSPDLKIWVRDNLIDDYKIAHFWSNFAEKISSILPNTIEFDTYIETLILGNETQWINVDKYADLSNDRPF